MHVHKKELLQIISGGACTHPINWSMKPLHSSLFASCWTSQPLTALLSQQVYNTTDQSTASWRAWSEIFVVVLFPRVCMCMHACTGACMCESLWTKSSVAMYVVRLGSPYVIASQHCLPHLLLRCSSARWGLLGLGRFDYEEYQSWLVWRV